jgi:hypothetical protein
MIEQHPIVAPPIVANIPPELMVRTQWVCWAFARRQDKWTKVPYTPGTTTKARSNAPTTWRTFAEALACYEQRPDFFSGIGYMFSKDDRYVGGDRDHNLDQAGIPHTYAEVSPSGCGIKFIGRACGDYGRKTNKGELYSKGRFFTITGDVLPGHETITDCQEEIDSFLASLGNPDRPLRSGGGGSGSRAEKVKLIPEEDWEAGRQLRRTGMNRLLARVRASAVSKKTGADDTQLGYLLREDYRGFHERWEYAGIVRGDGTLDSSQIRAVMASNIRSRGFLFPEFAALMSYFFGAECAAKWGTKQGVQEEFASLWFYGRTPRAEAAAPMPAPAPVKRGRGSNHAELLDRAYAALLDYRAGVDAILTVSDLATGLGVHRRTAITLLQELRTANRIDYKQFHQHTGILVSFSGVINKNPEQPDKPRTDRSNGHSPDREMGAALGIDHTSSGVINEETEDTEINASGSVSGALITPQDERGAEGTHIVYITSTCVTPPVTITPEKRRSIFDAVSEAFDALPHDRVADTGELKRWPITDARIVAYVQEQHAGERWKDDAIRYWAGKYRKRRKAAAFDELASMRRDALEKKAASARKQIARAETKAATEEMPELREWYAKRAAQLAGQQAMLGWELGRRDTLDAARIEASGYSQGEQQEMLELVEREYRPAPPPARAASVSPPSADVGGLVARLKARQVND